MTEKNKACSDSGCDRASCEGCEKNAGSFLEKTNDLNNIKHVIGVVSGKGGVGKSFVTAMLAVLMNRKGYGTGILDAGERAGNPPRAHA